MLCRGLHLVTAYLLQFRPVHRQFPNVWTFLIRYWGPSTGCEDGLYCEHRM